MKIISKVRNYFRVPAVARRYMFDGLFISTAVNIASNTNNLFATRLGASDYQLSMVQFMPMMFNLLLQTYLAFLAILMPITMFTAGWMFLQSQDASDIHDIHEE